MRKLIKHFTILYFLLTHFLTLFAQEVDVVDIIDLGKFQVGIQGQFSGVDLPYFKPEGITQIPSRYFQALIIHEMRADGIDVKPIENCFGSDDSRSMDIDVSTDEGYFNVRMQWHWAYLGLTNQVVRLGLFFRTSISRCPEIYNIPYGTNKVSLKYSIRFFIYDAIDTWRIIDSIEIEQKEVQWQLEWNLPEE